MILSNQEVKMSNTPTIGGMDKYEVEGAADTLMHAHEIRQKPKLNRLARKIMVKRLVALQKAIDWSENLSK